jgi:hypothetical protein
MRHTIVIRASDCCVDCGRPSADVLIDQAMDGVAKLSKRGERSQAQDSKAPSREETHSLILLPS